MGLLVIVALDREPVVTEPRDVFAALARIVEYADERLQAAALGRELPEPPVLRADLVSLRLLLGLTVVSQALTVAAVMGITRTSPAGLFRALGLHGYRAARLWRPVLMMVAAYGGVAVYATIVAALDIDVLIPESTVPDAVADDRAALLLTGVAAVIGAPISEEVLHRGLVFGGLARWGFWPAAAASAAVFAGIHLDPGSLIPFFGIGIVFAWVFWRSGSLWDAVICHGLFNLTSYVILISTGGSS